MPDAATHSDVEREFYRYQARKSKPPILWRELTATYHGDVDTGDCRFDVVAATVMSGHKLRVHGYEIKGTRSDFLSDMKTEKWRKYLSTGVHQVSYAMPRGIIDPDEIPDGIGLILLDRTTGMWRHTRKAPLIHDGDIPQNLLIRMLLRKNEETKPVHQRFREAETREERVARYAEHVNALNIVQGKVRDELASIAARERNVGYDERILARRERTLTEREQAADNLVPTLDAASDLFKYLARQFGTRAAGRDTTDHDFIEAVRRVLP